MDTLPLEIIFEIFSYLDFHVLDGILNSYVPCFSVQSLWSFYVSKRWPTQPEKALALGQGCNDTSFPPALITVLLKYVYPPNSLLLAIQCGNHRVVEALLLDYRTDPSDCNNFPIFLACRLGYEKIVCPSKEDCQEEKKCEKVELSYGATDFCRVW